MIEAHCHTNIDGYQMEKWPTQFVALPGIGDRVQAESGNVLKVVGITHTAKKVFNRTQPGENYITVPYIKVELHRMC